jgi:thioredoxin-like negative regulator of GroEL
LTRIPSEIYPAAMLYGCALLVAGKFDDASVAFLTASKQRPSNGCATQGRAEALAASGKSEAAVVLLNANSSAKPCQRPSL